MKEALTVLALHPNVLGEVHRYPVDHISLYGIHVRRVLHAAVHLQLIILEDVARVMGKFYMNIHTKDTPDDLTRIVHIKLNHTEEEIHKDECDNTAMLTTTIDPRNSMVDIECKLSLEEWMRISAGCSCVYRSGQLEKYKGYPLAQEL